MSNLEILEALLYFYIIFKFIYTWNNKATKIIKITHIITKIKIKSKAYNKKESTYLLLLLFSFIKQLKSI